MIRRWPHSRRPPGGRPTFSTIVWFATGMSLATLPFVGVIPGWLLAMVVIIAIWGLRQAWRGAAATPSVVRMCLSLGLLTTLWLTGNLGFGLDAAAPLFVGFLWIKLLEFDRERDVQMAAFLGLFLVTGVLLAGQSLLLTLQAVSAALVIISGMWWYQSPHLGGSSLPDRPPELRLTTPGATRRQALRILGKVLLLAAQALPFTLILFLCIPRPTLQLSLNSRNASAGISDHLEPGRFASNARNEQVAFRVEFPNLDMPFIDDLYWRGLVLWQTDGNAWRRAPDEEIPRRGWVTRSLPDSSASGGAAGVVAHPVDQDITLVANPNPWLYVLDTPRTQIDGARLLPGMMFERTEGTGGTTTYRATSEPSVRPADWGLIAQRYARQRPLTLDPRIEALASDLRGQATGTDAVVDRTIRWFTRQGFVYTLNPGEMGPNATATFLFERRKGFCGHYASAFAVLMRASGIPARVVLGYRGGEINQHGGFLVVRQTQAHAWAEVWTGSNLSGWRRVDLTSVIPAEDPATGRATTTPAAENSGAAARAAQRAAKPWPEQLLFHARLWYEYIDSRWDRWAVGYNSDLQAQLFGWLGLDEFGAWANGMGVAVGVMMAVITIALAWWLWPRLVREWSLSGEQRLYRRFTSAAGRVGVVRRANEGPRDHARRVAAACPAAATAVLAAGEAWLRLAYGVSTDPADRALVAAAVSALRRCPPAAKQPREMLLPSGGSTRTR